MACEHVSYHVNRKVGQHDGAVWYSAECDACGAVTGWCLTLKEASARMRTGGRWVTGEEDGRGPHGDGQYPLVPSVRLRRHKNPDDLLGEQR